MQGLQDCCRFYNWIENFFINFEFFFSNFYFFLYPFLFIYLFINLFIHYNIYYFQIFLILRFFNPRLVTLNIVPSTLDRRPKGKLL